MTTSGNLCTSACLLLLFFKSVFSLHRGVGEWKRWDWIYISPRHIFIVHDVFLIRIEIRADFPDIRPTHLTDVFQTKGEYVIEIKRWYGKGCFNATTDVGPYFVSPSTYAFKNESVFDEVFSWLTWKFFPAIFPCLFQSYYLSVPAPAHTNLCGQTRRNLLFCWLSVGLSKKKKSDWTDTTNKLALLIPQLPT